MTKITTVALGFLAAGVFTSVSILAGYEVLITVPMAYAVVRAFRQRDLRLPTSAWWLLAFALVALLSLVLNFDLLPKPLKNFGRLKYFIYGLAGLFIYDQWLAEASDLVKRRLLNLFFFSMVVAGAYTLSTLGSARDGRGGALTETMRYGYGTGMVLLMILSGFLHRQSIARWFDPRFAAVAFLFGFLGMYFTYTRGALLGFLCGVPVVFYLFRKRLGLWIGGAALACILGLGAAYLFGSGESGNRFLINKNNNSDVIRRSQWRAATIAIAERPVLGWGLANFHTQLKRIKRDYDLPAKKYNDAHSHNLFLEIGAGTGLVGLVLFIGWLAAWAWEMGRAPGLARVFVIPYGTALVVSSQFEVTLDANNAGVLFFLYALSVAGTLKRG